MLGSGTTTVEAGTLTGQINGGSKFDAYCVDLYHVVNVGGSGSSFLVDPLPIAQLGPQGRGAGRSVTSMTPSTPQSRPWPAVPRRTSTAQPSRWRSGRSNTTTVALLTAGSFTMQDSSNTPTPSSIKSLPGRPSTPEPLRRAPSQGTPPGSTASTHPVSIALLTKRIRSGRDQRRRRPPSRRLSVSSGLRILGSLPWRGGRRTATPGRTDSPAPRDVISRSEATASAVAFSHFEALFDPFDVLAGPRIDPDLLPRSDERRDLDLQAVLQDRFLVLVRRRRALQAETAACRITL